MYSAHFSPSVNNRYSKNDSEKARRLLLENFPEIVSATPWEIFCATSDSGPIFVLLVLETNRYAKQSNPHNFSVTHKEMQNFVGLLILSGYNMRYNFRDYWSKSKDLGCPAFSNTMSRARFQQIKSFFHVTNNNDLGSGKMAKITPLYDALNKIFKQFGILHNNLSVDESMVPYFERNSCKQFIRGKPIRFGFKL